ncbi:acetyltransferase [Methanobrevibacter ruminantium M1]|uniref:Acetyltransferase n=1 Tax=Methanobrevibacter ruminantium (strain ATCC 35063 / DSM 1093 / JCM 13430 / OCM 146 / M1) TaxID=634498 RepID=D3E307_METRM|nr:acetyltransferase [Methanobrevibacter ruminantium]ADC46918.1 acetyltransferase [Methanobrevibacter ruminantium M1]
MEFIKYKSQFEKMIDNKIIGMPELIDSNISFKGKNNILCCNNIKLENIDIDFNGNNSVIFLGSNLGVNSHLTIFNNSTLFLGKNNTCGSSISISVAENQNLIIGDNCIVESDVKIRTSDNYPIYNYENSRINHSNSVFIGDNVLLGESSFISRGVKIGSGSIISPCSFLPPLFKAFSNSYVLGNPGRILKEDVYFVNDSINDYTIEEIKNSSINENESGLFDFVEKETLSLDKIDNILKKFNSEDSLDFIQKLFLQNKHKNRFFIE